MSTGRPSSPKAAPWALGKPKPAKPRTMLQTCSAKCSADVGVGGKGAVDESLAVAVDRLLGRLRLIARRRPSACAGGEPRERAGDFDHLVLKDDRPQCLAERLLQRWVQVRDWKSGFASAPWRRSM